MLTQDLFTILLALSLLTVVAYGLCKLADSFLAGAHWIRDHYRIY